MFYFMSKKWCSSKKLKSWQPHTYTLLFKLVNCKNAKSFNIFFSQVAMDWENEFIANVITDQVPNKPKGLQLNALAERRWVEIYFFNHLLIIFQSCGKHLNSINQGFPTFSWSKTLQHKNEQNCFCVSSDSTLPTF